MPLMRVHWARPFQVNSRSGNIAGFLAGWWLRRPDAGLDVEVFVATILDAPSLKAAQLQLKKVAARAGWAENASDGPCILGEMKFIGSGFPSMPGTRRNKGGCDPHLVLLQQTSIEKSGELPHDVTGTFLHWAPTQTVELFPVHAVQHVVYCRLPPQQPLMAQLFGESPKEETQVELSKWSIPFMAPSLHSAQCLAAVLKREKHHSPGHRCACATLLAFRMVGSLCALMSVVSAQVLYLLELPTRFRTLFQACRASACLRQCWVRLEVQSWWLNGYIQANHDRSEHAHGQRVALVSSVMMVLCDILLGIVVSAILENQVSVASVPQAVVKTVNGIYGTFLQSLVHWLMGVPADFKLNGEFTSFMGGVCISMFSLWQSFAVQVCSPSAAWILLRTLQLGSVCGASFFVCMCMDLLAFAMVPLLIACVGIAQCWKIALRSLSTLVLLFRGKKHNVLRSRVDHHNFDLDQLLMGAMLLCMSVFLLPSVFMFHACFSAAWLLVVFAYSLAALLVFNLNHLPAPLLLLGSCGYLRWPREATLSLSHHPGRKAVPKPLVAPCRLQEAGCTEHVILRLEWRPWRWPTDFLAPYRAAVQTAWSHEPARSIIARLVGGEAVPLRHFIWPPNFGGRCDGCYLESRRWLEIMASLWTGEGIWDTQL